MTAGGWAEGEDDEQGAIGYCRAGRRLWLRGPERPLPARGYQVRAPPGDSYCEPSTHSISLVRCPYSSRAFAAMTLTAPGTHNLTILRDGRKCTIEN